jgi:hypothetical protein
LDVLPNARMTSKYITFEQYVVDVYEKLGTESQEFKTLCALHGLNKIQEIYEKAKQKEKPDQRKVVGRDDF